MLAGSSRVASASLDFSTFDQARAIIIGNAAQALRIARANERAVARMQHDSGVFVRTVLSGLPEHDPSPNLNSELPANPACVRNDRSSRTLLIVAYAATH